MTTDTAATGGSVRIRVVRVRPDQVLVSSMKNSEIIAALEGLHFIDHTARRTVELDLDVRNFLLDFVAARCGKLFG